MIFFEEVGVSVVQRHEIARESAARLGTHGMDSCCPTNQFRSFRVQLKQPDEDRLFLLGLTEFINKTQGQTCRLRDVLPRAAEIPRVASFTTAKFDLRSRQGFELVLVSAELDGAPLVAIDGNHRAIAQYLTFRSVEGVPAFLCVHPEIDQWNYVPKLARAF